jgi:hypothetical protein
MQYIPILKAKDAEFRALALLEPDIKAGLTPLIDLVPLNEDDDVDSWITKTAEKLQRAWLISRPIFVDALAIRNLRTSQDESAYANLVRTSTDYNINIVPVTGLSRGDDHQSAIRNLLAIRGIFGLCLRLAGNDFESDSPAGSISDLLQEVGSQEESTDLLLDFGEVPPDNAGPVSTMMYSYLETIPNINKWRSVTTSATAIPRHVGHFNKDSIGRTPRTEWRAWRALQKRAMLRRPQFSDYTIQHPELVVFDGKIMNPSAHLRYATEQDWLIVRGRGVKTGKHDQMHSLCGKLILHPEYKGPNYSWGDQWIMNCAKRLEGPGNPNVWRRVGLNHHLTLVVQQLASLAST